MRRTLSENRQEGLAYRSSDRALSWVGIAGTRRNTPILIASWLEKKAPTYTKVMLRWVATHNCTRHSHGHPFIHIRIHPRHPLSTPLPLNSPPARSPHPLARSSKPSEQSPWDSKLCSSGIAAKRRLQATPASSSRRQSIMSRESSSEPYSSLLGSEDERCAQDDSAFPSSEPFPSYSWPLRRSLFHTPARARLLIPRVSDPSAYEHIRILDGERKVSAFGSALS